MYGTFLFFPLADLVTGDARTGNALSVSAATARQSGKPILQKVFITPSFSCLVHSFSLSLFTTNGPVTQNHLKPTRIIFNGRDSICNSGHKKQRKILPLLKIKVLLGNWACCVGTLTKTKERRVKRKSRAVTIFLFSFFTLLVLYA